MKKILFPIYHFLPCATTHIHRLMRFLNYLADIGEYEITVLTVRNPDDIMYDETLIKKLNSGIQIIRTASLFFGIHNRTKIVAEYRRDKQSESRRKSGKEIFRTFFRIFIRPILNMINTPDNCVGWLPFAIYRGRKLMHDNKYDMIFCTGPPFSNFILSAILKTDQTRLVLDYRDPWKNNEYMEKNYLFKWQHKISQKWEAYVLRRTNGIIANTKTMLDFISEQNKHVLTNLDIKTTVIYNGVSFRQSIKPVKSQNRKIMFLHSGRFHGAIRTPKFFMEAMRALIDQGKIAAGKIEAVFLGNLSPSDFDQFSHIQTDDFCRFPGIVSHDENLRLINEADCLIVIGGNGPHDSIYVPSKIFEYLQTSNLILGLLPHGEAFDILENTGGAILTDTQHSASIQEAILEVIRRIEKNEPTHRNTEYLTNQFDCNRLNEKLNDFLKTV